MRNKNRTAAIDWFIQRDWELAITLTFKKDCTEHRARKTMRRLWNGIDRQLYHKAFWKHIDVFEENRRKYLAVWVDGKTAGG